MLLQKNTGKFYLNNLKINLQSSFDSFKVNEPYNSISQYDISTFRLSPNIKVATYNNFF